MDVLVDNEITIKNLSKDIEAYIKADLTIPNPKYQQNARLGYSNYNVPSQLYFYKKDGDNYIIPFGYFKKLWSLYPKKEAYEILIKEPEKLHFKSLINPYDYQEDAIQEALKAKNGILVMPAGSGKTQTMLEIIARLGIKTLWLTHTIDLLNQSYDRAKSNLPGAGLEKIANGRIAIGSHITFATVQTLSNINLAQYKNKWGMVVVDECHRVCGTPASTSMFYKVISSLSARYKIGLTATPYRNAKGTEKAMFSLLGDIITEVPKEAVKTIKAKIKPIYTDFIIADNALKADGTIDYTKLVGVMADNAERNELIASHIKENSDKYCLVLSDRLSNLQALQRIVGSGVIIDGKTKKDIREASIQRVKAGLTNILYATYALAKEGLDIPRLERLFLAMPRKDKATIIQAVGRIERLFDGKSEPIVYDFVDAADFYENQYTVRKRIYKKNGNEVM